jgi:predicted transcriptional regulator
VAAAWKLGDCNNTSVFILIGKDGKVVHEQRGPIRGDDIPKIVEMIAKLVEAG